MKNVQLMRVAALVCLVFLFCTTAVSAYQISFTVPESVKVGQTFVVQGESNLPSGFTTELYLYREVPNFQPKQISVDEFTIQEGGDWQIVYDTTGWQKATYKIEVPKNSRYSYGSDSVTFRTFVVWDRSDEVEVTSPETQSYDGTLDIAGKAVKLTGGAGIKIDVSGPSGGVFGPTYIPTDAEGLFSCEVPISGPGTYTVAFSDEDDLITTAEVTITENPALTATITATTTAGTAATLPPETQSPLSVFSVLAGTAASAALVLKKRG